MMLFVFFKAQRCPSSFIFYCKEKSSGKSSLSKTSYFVFHKINNLVLGEIKGTNFAYIFESLCII